MHHRGHPNREYTALAVEGRRRSRAPRSSGRQESANTTTPPLPVDGQTSPGYLPQRTSTHLKAGDAAVSPTLLGITPTTGSQGQKTLQTG